LLGLLGIGTLTYVSASDGKKRYLPRTFSTRERGVLGRVIQALYQERHITPDTQLRETPILADLLTLLEAEDKRRFGPALPG
jgi:hypothetical protein